MGYDLESKVLKDGEGYFRVTSMAMGQIADVLLEAGVDTEVIDSLRYNNGQIIGKRAAKKIAAGIRKWAETAVPGETEIVDWNVSSGRAPVEANYIEWFLEFAEFNEEAAPYRVF